MVTLFCYKPFLILKYCAIDLLWSEAASPWQAYPRLWIYKVYLDGGRPANMDLGGGSPAKMDLDGGSPAMAGLPAELRACGLAGLRACGLAGLRACGLVGLRA
jgi:hypothetical protein